jgi:general secretion pathway protein K
VCAFSLCSNKDFDKRSYYQRGHQQGTVLVLVLLIVALVAGLSVKYAAQYQLGMARAETRWHGAQARAFLEGTEEVAKLMFPEADLDANIDFLGEPWASEVPIEDEGVSGFARMTDATTQLNLNDLAQPIEIQKPEGDSTRYKEAHRRFIRLLQTFPDMPLDQGQAEFLTAAVVDWLDGDDMESGAGGAERNYYQGLPDPYLPANTAFKSVDELRMVRGFNEAPLLVTRMLPFVTVLPVADAGLNINTLDIVGPDGKGFNNVLATINGAADLTPSDPADMVQFIATRPEEGFRDTQAIIEAWNNMFAGKQLDTAGLNVNTKFFWLNSTVQLVDQRRSMRSLMMRGDQPGSLIVKQRDDVFEWPSVIYENEDDDDELVK